MEKIMQLANNIPEMQKKAEINEQRLIEIHQMLKYLSKREIEREKHELEFEVDYADTKPRFMIKGAKEKKEK